MRNRVAAKPAITTIFLLMALFGFDSCCSMSQTLTIRLLNAKTGKPMKDKMVTLLWTDRFDSSEVKLNAQGFGTVEVPQGAKEFSLETGPKVGKDPYRIAYQNCNVDSRAVIQVANVIEKGYVPRNVCGSKSAAARPGEIVFWALQRPWWKPDMQ